MKDAKESHPHQLYIEEISIGIKGKNTVVNVVKAHSTLTNSDFMDALQ